jgi:hypothetical protein
MSSLLAVAWVVWPFVIAGGLAAAVLLLILGLRLRGRHVLASVLAAQPPAARCVREPRLTFVCPVTKPAVAADLLLAGLDDLNEPAERILYDNTGGRALVAARLFNVLAPEVRTEYVAFCHQDWRPLDRDWIARTLAVFEAHPACEMVAQIGIAADKRTFAGRIVKTFGYMGRAGSHLLHAPDEICFVLRTARVREWPFDEAHLPEFHYYAVDYAYELQRRGLEVWSTPALGYHGKSLGAVWSHDFRRARKILRTKYGPRMVRAPTGWI